MLFAKFNEYLSAAMTIAIKIKQANSFESTVYCCWQNSVMKECFSLKLYLCFKLIHALTRRVYNDSQSDIQSYSRGCEHMQEMQLHSSPDLLQQTSGYCGVIKSSPAARPFVGCTINCECLALILVWWCCVEWHNLNRCTYRTLAITGLHWYRCFVLFNQTQG